MVVSRNILFGICFILFSSSFCALEPNYLFQLEHNTHTTFWKSDMDYMRDFLLHTKFPNYEYEFSRWVKCQIINFNITSLAISTENLVVDLEPENRRMTFTQPKSFSYEAEFIWEYNLLYLPITGTAKFKGHAKNVLYTLNMTEPFEGKLFIPDLFLTWVIDYEEINSPFGNFMGIKDYVRSTFESDMTEQILLTLNEDIDESISEKYQQYYFPHGDEIKFEALSGKTVSIMRRYKKTAMDEHVFGMGYHETIEESQIPKKDLKVSQKSKLKSVEGSGVLRRYLRDLTIFEQIAKSAVGLINHLTILDKDLPKDQKTRLDASSIQRMLPDFKMKFGVDAEIRLEVTGQKALTSPMMYKIGGQSAGLHGLVVDFEFYVKHVASYIKFLTTRVVFNFGIKPVISWIDGNAVINFDLLSNEANVISAESEIFKNDIIKEGIRDYMTNGVYEFLKVKAENSLMGDGLKIRDELGEIKKMKYMVDISGRTLNIWIYEDDL